MKIPLILSIAVMGIGGLMVSQRPLYNSSRHNEAWLRKQVPRNFNGYSVSQPYKMDPETYKILDPYGIISRIMTNGNKSFDAVFIASDSSLSFHDPMECFSGQYNEILSKVTVQAPTKSFGNVPVTLMLLKNTNLNEDMYAAYCYMTPEGIVPSPDQIHFIMFKHEILTATPQQGAFYRVINQVGGEDNQSKDATIQFLADYIDAIHNRDPKDF